MDYSECLSYIESLSPTLEKPSLTRIAAFMADHGNWQNQYPIIHVAGTNGKGSTVALIDSIARAANLKVGRFTGPHLLRWNERFHINGKPISDAEFARIGTYIRQLSQEFGERNPEIGPLTWFEFLTSIAFYWFSEQRVDLAVIEVGLGGRFDATNVVENVLVSVITNIDLDHTHILGNTVEEIAFEKSGIVKAGVPVVSGATGAALDVIRARCDELGCKLYSEFDESIHRDFDAAKKSLALLGSYQQKNGLLAVAAFHISGLTERCKQNPAKVIQSGFETAYWPGRLQLIRGAESKKEIILDGAHNAAGAVALRSALDRMHPDAKFQFVIGCFENKNARQIVDALVRAGDSVYASQAATKRATFDKGQLALFCKERGASAATYDTIADAFHAANANAASAANANAASAANANPANAARANPANAGDANPANFANVNPSDSHLANASVSSTDIEGDIIVVTGSFATVREVMLALGWKSVEDGSPECVRISDGQ